MRQYRVAVTFESNTQAPKTHKLDVKTGGPSSAIARGIRETKKRYPGARWDSLCIILEKMESKP